MTSPLMMPTRRADHAANVRYPAPAPVAYTVEDDPHCFVCHRHTDHFAEHDGLVEAGLATYAEDGSVHRTEKWDDDLATQIFEAEYARLTTDN